MPLRYVPLVENEVYHIYNKSIAGFKIFNHDWDYKRMLHQMIFYSLRDRCGKFSTISFQTMKPHFIENFLIPTNRLLDIIAYCIMPTHIHLLVKQIVKNGITIFMTSLLQSYSQYFNAKYKRKGPLWEGRFRNVLVKNENQFLHVTRYIHLNPVTEFIVNKPEDWKYSSYREYTDSCDEEKICNLKDYLDIDKNIYAEFVTDHIDYQRDLNQYKNLFLE